MTETRDFARYAGRWQIHAPDAPLGTQVELDENGKGKTNTHVNVQLGPDDPGFVRADVSRDHPPLSGAVRLVVDGPTPDKPDTMDGPGNFVKEGGVAYSADVTLVRQLTPSELAESSPGTVEPQ